MNKQNCCVFIVNGQPQNLLKEGDPASQTSRWRLHFFWVWLTPRDRCGWEFILFNMCRRLNLCLLSPACAYIVMSSMLNTKMEKSPHSGWRSPHFPVTASHLRGGNTAEIWGQNLHSLSVLKGGVLAAHSLKTYICNQRQTAHAFWILKRI